MLLVDDVALNNIVTKGLLEVTTAIRNMTNTTGDSYYATVPILALTANAVTGMREMFMDNGMQDYITKPVEGVRLISTMRKWLPQDKLIFDIPEEEPEEKVSLKEVLAELREDAENFDMDGLMT